MQENFPYEFSSDTS